MKKNFNLAAALQSGFDFMIKDPKTFFIPVAGAVILMWLFGFVLSHLFFLFPFAIEQHSIRIEIYGLVLQAMRIVIAPLIISVFIVIFMQAFKDKKQIDSLSMPSSKSILNMILYAAAIYIIPVMLIKGGAFLMFMLLDSGNFNPLLVLGLAGLLCLFGIAYFVAFSMSIFAPFYYLAQQKDYIGGFKQSFETANQVFAKLILTVLGFAVIFAILSIVPNIIQFIIGSIVMTPGIAVGVSVFGILVSLITFTFAAYGVSVFTHIFLEINGSVKQAE